MSFASASFTGAFTNLHQGFEELHEAESTVGRAWADAQEREGYVRAQETLKKFIGSPFLADRGMATRAELVKAGLDPEIYIQFSKDWYDGSIRGMDTELERLVGRLQELRLRESSLIAFFADHGEEFHEHGRMWHGQSIYGEMVRVPLLLWGPGRVPKAVKVEEPVELIDLMPTLLEYAGLPVPQGVQGRSLRPLLTTDRPGEAAVVANGWKRRAVFAEKQAQGGKGHPLETECYAIVDGNWKLIHNVARPPERPEFELFEFYRDPLDQKDVAAQHPDVVERLGKALDAWKRKAIRARLKSDSEGAEGMTAEQLARLRSLGYVR